MMKHFLEVFEEAETICIPSSSCVAMIRDHYPKMAASCDDPSIAGKVANLLPRVFEFSELLVDKLNVVDVGAFYPHSVTLHPSCHSLRSLQVGDKPERLLRGVRGLTLTDLPNSDIMLRFRRHLRYKECRGIRRHPVGENPERVKHASGSMHCARQFLPDAHRRSTQPPTYWGEMSASRGNSGCHRRRSFSMSTRVGHASEALTFPEIAHELLQNTQLRHNVHHATDVIRRKRAHVVDELPDWEQLRDTAHEIKEHTLRYLGFYLEQFEAACTAAGGKIHWARDADEANHIIIGIIESHNEKEVIKVKTMTSDEIVLNEALEAAGISPYETDLADLIVQLGQDKPSHIVVPALHRNRMEIHRIFREKMNLPDLGAEAEELAAAARHYLREKFLRVKVAISGANFSDRRNGIGGRRRIRGQRKNVRFLAEGVDHTRGNRKGNSSFYGSGSLSAVASSLRDRRAHESL